MWTLRTDDAWYVRPRAEVEARAVHLEARGVSPDALSAACVSVERLADALRMPFRAAATAMLYVQLYYYGAPAAETYPPPLDVALAALFVSGKAEESHKKLVPFLRTAAFLALHPRVAPEAVATHHASEVDAVYVGEEHRAAVTRHELGVLSAASFRFCVRPLTDVFADAVAALWLMAAPGHGRKAAGVDRRAGARSGFPPVVVLERMHALALACYRDARLLLCYEPEVLALAAARVAGLDFALAVRLDPVISEAAALLSP